MTRDYKNELIDRSKQDGASRMMVNKCFLQNTIKVSRDSFCIFICKCGRMGKRNIRQILGDYNKNNGYGFQCKICVRDNKNITRGKRTTIYEIYKNNAFKWWIVKIGKNYKYLKHWTKIDILNICKIEYERSGIKALIPKYLDNLPGIAIYSSYIKSYMKDENIINIRQPNYPSLWICEKLKLVNERKEYLKNIFPCETDTFEELCEIHIRPFLDNYLKNININGFILDSEIFKKCHKNDVTPALKKYKKNIHHIRQYFNLSTRNLESLRKDSDGYYETRNSKAEIVFDNFLVLYTKLTNENVKWEELYPPDFIDKYDKNCKIDCKITINDKIIIIEIWNFSKDNKKNLGNQKKRYEDYIKKRKIKEDYWKKRDDIIFIGIDHDKLYGNQDVFKSTEYCKKILSPYISILEIPNNIRESIFTKNNINLMLEKCKESFSNNNNRLYSDKLDKKILTIISKIYGNRTKGLFELRKILHEKINDINWINIYTNNISPDGIKKKSNNIKLAHSNKSIEEKKK